MSVDPDLAETGEPYAYAGDDPVNASDPTGEACTGIGNCEAVLSHNANALTAFNYFLKTDHFTQVQAAGFVGNLETESNVTPDCVGGFGPCEALGKTIPYTSPFGIAQWLNGRTYTLFAFAKQLGFNQSQTAHSLTVQLDFMSAEMGIGPFSKNVGWGEREYGIGKIRAALTPASAAEEIAYWFEGAIGGVPITKANPYGIQALSERQDAAEAAYALWGTHAKHPQESFYCPDTSQSGGLA